MAQCCGGNAAALLAARAAWDGTAPDTGGLTLNITTRNGRGLINGDANMIVQGAPDNGGITPVRLEFTGERQGAVTYHGLEGRQYRGGNNPLERYINAHPDDVNKLTGSGDWKQVSIPVLADVESNGRQDAEENRPRATRNPVPVPTEAADVIETPEATIKVKEVEVGGERVKVKRTKAKDKAETKLLDLPEQD